MEILGQVYYMIIALIVGSFLNACIYRLSNKLTMKDNKGRSMCPSCQHTLRAVDLIPVLSYVSLGGKCRYCKAKISKQYPLIELANVVLWGLLLLEFGWSVKTGVLAVFFSVLLVMLMVDLKAMIIPHVLTGTILLLAIISFFVPEFAGVKEQLIGCLVVSVPMQIIAIVIPGGFGGGDINLMAVAGLLLGYKIIVVSMFFALIVGAIYGVVVMKGQRKKGMRIPFGPFLAVGMYISTFFGEGMWDSYMALF